MVLRLLEQILGSHVRHDHVEHHADALAELIEEHLVNGAERVERRQFDHRLHFALEEDGQDEHVDRSAFTQPRATGFARNVSISPLGMRVSSRSATRCGRPE